MQINYNSYSYASASLKISLQSTAGSGAAAQGTGASEDAGSNQDSFLSAKDPVTGLSMVNQMKADLQSRQTQLFNHVQSILSKQGIQVTLGQGFWRTLSEGNFQVDEKTQAAAQEAISENGCWGVKQTSGRLLAFAQALTGGDASKAEEMRQAVQKGFEAAEKAWGGALPQITRDTYDATMKLFDDWANGTSGAEAGESAGTSNSASVSLEYGYARVSSGTVSVQDAAWLENSGVLSDISAPLSYNGMTLNSAWSMNEKVTVTVTLNGGVHGNSTQAVPGRDSFVHSSREDCGSYDPKGRAAGRHDEGRRHGPKSRPTGRGREMALSFYKPLRTGNGESGSVRVNGEEIPLHEDGTVTVGLPDGTLRRAKVNQEALDKAAVQGRGKAEEG